MIKNTNLSSSHKYYYYRRLTCPMGDRHACGVQSELKYIYLNVCTYFNIYSLFIFIGIMKGLQWCMSVSDVSPISIYVGLRSGMLMSVSDEACRGLRWVSYKNNFSWTPTYRKTRFRKYNIFSEILTKTQCLRSYFLTIFHQLWFFQCWNSH